MKLKTLKRYTAIYLVNHVLAGTRSFAAKRRLLRSAGYDIGEGTKVVGPVFCTGRLSIGANCWIGRNFTVNGNGSVTIGDNCDLAPDVTFCTGGHKVGSHERRAGQGESYDISVGSGVWIGIRATVLGNTAIGDGSVVAACACVTWDVPADSLVAGVPAKIVKEYKNGAAITEKE